jgi:hypothetical protein
MDLCLPALPALQEHIQHWHDACVVFDVQTGELVMLSRVVICAAATWLVASAASAGNGCDSASMRGYRDCLRIVDSLRPDKAGQARVFAIDGSEFTAGQAQWMKGQLRKVERLCASGNTSDQAEAAKRLADVEELLKSHQRRS